MDFVPIRESLYENGWVLVKNVFTKDEIQQMRQAIYKAKAEGIKGDLLSNQYLYPVLTDKRIVDIAKGILQDTPVYFGDSGYLVNNKQWGWHKDNPDRLDSNAPDWKSPYSVIRFGIYLQNHVNNSGGLLLRDHSHHTPTITVGKPLNVPVEPGDVVVWFLTTTHSGNAKLFKFAPNLIVNPKYYNFIPKFLFREEKDERIGIFLTYAKEDAHLARYLKYLKTRQYAVNTWQSSNYISDGIEALTKQGAKFMDIRPDVKTTEVNQLNKEHADIPY